MLKTENWQNPNIEDGDLSLYQCGWEECAPNHSYGPAVRNHFLMHCVFQGEGEFQADGQTYRLKAGQGFLIFPGVVTFYQADGEHPWHYGWVGFNGRKAAGVAESLGLSRQQPIFTFQDNGKVQGCIESMTEQNMIGWNRFAMLSKLYEFYSLLFHPPLETKNSVNYVLDAATDYIRKNYSYKITVESLSRHVGLGRSQLFRIFKQRLNLSPQQYLIEFRLRRAEELMRFSSLTVTEILFSCGFNDLCHFSRLFKKAFGAAPTVYAKTCRAERQADEKESPTKK